MGTCHSYSQSDCRHHHCRIGPGLQHVWYVCWTSSTLTKVATLRDIRLLDIFGMKKSRTTVYHSQGDEMIEKFNRSLLQLLCVCTFKIRLIVSTIYHLCSSPVTQRCIRPTGYHPLNSCPAVLPSPLHYYPSMPLMWIPTNSTYVLPLLNCEICGDAHHRSSSLSETQYDHQCKTIYFKFTTVSGWLFWLQGSWNQGSRDGRSNPSRDPTPTYEINDGAATSTDYSAESNSHSEHQLTVPTSRMVGLPLLSMKRWCLKKLSHNLGTQPSIANLWTD